MLFIFLLWRRWTASKKKDWFYPALFRLSFSLIYLPLAAIDVYCQGNLESAFAGLFHLLTAELRIVAWLNQSLSPTFRFRLCRPLQFRRSKKLNPLLFSRISLMHNNIFIILKIFTRNFRRLSALQQLGYNDPLPTLWSLIFHCWNLIDTVVVIVGRTPH